MGQQIFLKLVLQIANHHHIMDECSDIDAFANVLNIKTSLSITIYSTYSRYTYMTVQYLIANNVFIHTQILTRIVFLQKNRCLPPFDVKSMSH